MIQVAFYKRSGRIFDSVVSRFTQGPYSHCEVILSDSTPNGTLCASAQMLKGVRFVYKYLDPNDWDIIEIPGDSKAVFDWFVTYEGSGYDYFGLVGFFAPWGNVKSRFFCSEAVGASLKIVDPWRFDPNRLAAVLLSMGGKRV